MILVEKNKRKNKLSHSLKKEKEISLHVPFCKGSYTIEAAVILPLFITFMMFAVYFYRILQVEAGVQQALDFASATVAVTTGDEIEDDAQLAAAIALFEEQLLANNVPVSFISGSQAGINLLESSAEGNYIDLKASYTMHFPIGLLSSYNFDINQNAKSRKWVGYDPAENSWDGRWVYMTDNGEVYHTHLDCSYLDLSIHSVDKSQVDEERNESGAKYYPCPSCKAESASGSVYITDYGRQYHSSLTCYKLKRSINKVLLWDVDDAVPECLKCERRDNG